MQGFIQKFWLGVGEIKCMLGGGGGGGGGGVSVTFPVKKKRAYLMRIAIEGSAVNFEEVLDIFKQKSDCRLYSCVRIIIKNLLFWGFLGWGHFHGKLHEQKPFHSTIPIHHSSPVTVDYPFQYHTHLCSYLLPPPPSPHRLLSIAISFWTTQ